MEIDIDYVNGRQLMSVQKGKGNSLLAIYLMEKDWE